MVSELYRSGFIEYPSKFNYKKVYYITGVYHDYNLNGDIDYLIYACFTGRQWYIIDGIKKIKVKNIDDIFDLYPFLKYFEGGEFVYFIKKSDSNEFKIGKTINLDDRLNFFGVKLPFDWSVPLVYIMGSGESLKFEKAYHLALNDCRKNGEWFTFNNEKYKLIFKHWSMFHNKTFETNFKLFQ